MPTSPKLTLDTNCAINLFDSSSTTATSVADLKALVRLAMKNVADIAITTRTEDDLGHDRDEARRAEMLRMLEMFPVVGSILRWDTSSWDGGDLWADEDAARVAEEVQRILFPGLTPGQPRFGNRINDVDHLVGHFINKRDIFVTDDSRMVDRGEALKRSLGIIVMRPAEALAHVEGIEARKKPQTLPSDDIDPNYHSRAAAGTVTFDYSNNSHRFTIGEGQWLFETRWSKASDASIHAYNDAPSIDAIAVAKGVWKIGEISDAAIFDFSSRSRTPLKGQVIVWRNVNGLYAATMILGIRDNTRGGARDELTFEYVILKDGASFAS
jgi:hypothetical protein